MHAQSLRGAVAAVLLFAPVVVAIVSPAMAARIESRVWGEAPRSDVPTLLPETGSRPSAERESDLRRRIERDDGDAEAWRDLGYALFRRGALPEAMEAWGRAADLDPVYPPADLTAEIEGAMAMQRDGRPEVARARIAEIARRHDGNPHFHLMRGEQAMRSRAWAEAEAAYRRANELAPDLFVTSLNLARMLEFGGDQAEARRLYLAATAAAPERAAPWDHLGAHQFRQGLEAEALESLRRAESADPAWPLAEIRLAELSREADDLIGARRWYKAAILRAESGGEALRVALSDAQLRLGLIDEARETLDAVLAVEESAPVLVARAWVDEEAGDLDAAIARYRRAVVVDPGNLVAANNLAMALVKADSNPEEALAHAAYARDRLPDNARILGTHALAVAHVGDDATAAREALARAVRLEPSDPWIRFFLGRLLAEAGEVEAARVHLEAVTILDPDFPRRSVVQELISRF